MTRHALILALLVVTTSVGHAGACLSESLERAEALVVEHRYEDAERLVQESALAHPDSPSVALQEVVLYYTWIDDFGIVDSLAPHFAAAVERTIQVAGAALETDQANARALFARGSAMMYRTVFRAYTEGVGLANVPSLVGDARAGIEDMEAALAAEPEFHDPMVGIGKYRYWKYDRLPWPFSSDKDRRAGLGLLEAALQLGVQSEAGAIQTLGWTYVSEGRYEDAKRLVAPMIERYPESRFFREIRARALLYEEHWDAAREEYGELLEILAESGGERPFLQMKYGARLAQIDEKTGRHYEACMRAQRLRRLDYSGVHERWLSKRMRLVTDIMRTSCPRASRERRR